jgi:hypothetical protein
LLQDAVGIGGHVLGGGLHGDRCVNDAAAGVEVAEGLRVVLDRSAASGVVAEHLGECAGASDKVELVLRIDALRDGDDVRRAAFTADLGDGLVDEAMRGRVEKIGVDAGDFVAKFRVGHERTEDGALGGGALGNGAFHFRRRLRRHCFRGSL